MAIPRSSTAQVCTHRAKGNVTFKGNDEPGEISLVSGGGDINRGRGCRWGGGGEGAHQNVGSDARREGKN